ncbi:MAG: hypothetical protein DWQ07_20005 [Chloroflexi bacterium]|nr:MAG: hypothetical protein DWQ07_20005 [Chloroflexota bacterium]MBL1194368.1 hypothetical protein [Chloroflexota bacterium]NOH11656.1 hypothetical protein [Chloroflexota bacterium]
MDRDSRLNKILKYLFGVMDEAPPRSPEASEATKSRFLTHAKRYKRARDRAAAPASPVLRARRIRYQAVLGTLLVLFFLFAGGLGSTAYAAQGALPGEPLYDMKLLFEDTRILFANSTEGKLSLHLSFANERVFELRNSLNSNDEISLMAVKHNFDYHVNSAQLIIAQDASLLAYENELEKINLDYYMLVSNEEEPPGESASFDGTPTATATQPFIVTNTLVPSAGPTITPTQNMTQGSAPTDTPSPILDTTPTIIHSLTLSPSPTLTLTPQPEPSQTTTPTSTLTVTATHTVDMCGGISLSSLWFDEQQVFRTIINNSPSTITISQLLLEWPEDNEELIKIELNDDAIWDQKDTEPPSNIPAESGWKLGVDRVIGVGQSLEIMFQFDEDAESGDYNTTLTFDNACQVQATN